MNPKKIMLVVGGVSLVGLHAAHDAHVVKSEFEKSFVANPVAEVPVYVRLPHGDEPESPTGPLRTPWATAVTTWIGF